MEYTPFFIIAPPSSDYRSNYNGGGPWGRWSAGGGPIHIESADDSGNGLTIARVGSTSVYTITKETNNWSSTILEGDYVCIPHGGANYRGYVTDITDQVLTVQTWNNWITLIDTYTNMVINFGGSFLSMHSPVSFSLVMSPSFMIDNKPPAIYIQKQTLLLSDDVTLVTSGTYDVPLSIIGYKEIPGDACEGDDRPVFSGSNVSVKYRSFWILSNLILEAVDLTLSKAITLDNCVCENKSLGIGAAAIKAEGVYNLLLRTTVKSRMDASTASILTNGNGNLQVIGSVFDGTGGYGLNGNTGPGGSSTFIDSIFRGFAGNIWNDHESGYSGHWVFINCVFDSNLSGSFFRMATTAFGNGDQLRFLNCIFRNPYNGYVFQYSSVILQHCAMYSEEEFSGWSDPANPTVIIGSGNLILESDPFIDAENGDYRINTASAAGRQLLNVGYPSSLPGLSSSTSYSDIGACQQRPVLLEPIA